MAFIEWNDSTKVGISFIDTDHKKLFDLVNSLHSAMREGKGREVMGPTLKELVAYTDYHFKNEERAMTTHAYPLYNEHKAIHDDLRKKAVDLLTGFEGGKSIMTVEVAEFLKSWLQHHISQKDRELAAFLKTKGVA